jgi:hypothetical protein
MTFGDVAEEPNAEMSMRAGTGCEEAAIMLVANVGFESVGEYEHEQEQERSAAEP